MDDIITLWMSSKYTIASHNHASVTWPHCLAVCSVNCTRNCNSANSFQLELENDDFEINDSELDGTL